jgi:hypothetical protein
MRRLVSESRVPYHKVGKAFDLARRLHHPHRSHGSGYLGQSAGYGDDQVCTSDGEDCRHKVGGNKCDPPFQAKLAQGPVWESLLPLPGLNHCVGKVQILF